MRHARRGGHGGLEFGGSGEDSFVAVVVTKLTGALLFILLLTMVIMALIPRATDRAHDGRREEAAAPELTITTPGALPEAIAGRPYAVALAAAGAKGPLTWRVEGALPAGLALDAETGQIRGTPAAGTPRPVELVIRAHDGARSARRTTQLVVYQPDRPLTMPGKWAPHLPPVPVRAWLEQGFGFLVLVLVHMVGMNTLTSLERGRADAAEPDLAARRRFRLYRATVRLATLAAIIALAVWLAAGRAA
jgi:hypothetical protein